MNKRIPIEDTFVRTPRPADEPTHRPAFLHCYIGQTPTAHVGIDREDRICRNYDEVAEWLKGIPQGPSARFAFIAVPAQEHLLWEIKMVRGKPVKQSRYDGRPNLKNYRLIATCAWPNDIQEWDVTYSMNWSTRRALAKRGIGQLPPAGWSNTAVVPLGKAS